MQEWYFYFKVICLEKSFLMANMLICTFFGHTEDSIQIKNTILLPAVGTEIGQGWSSRKIHCLNSHGAINQKQSSIPSHKHPCVPNYFKNVFQDPKGECSGSKIKRKWTMQEIKIIQQKTPIFFPLVLGPLKYREEIKIWFLPSGRMQSSWRDTSSTCEMQRKDLEILTNE